MIYRGRSANTARESCKTLFKLCKFNLKYHLLERIHDYCHKHILVFADFEMQYKTLYKKREK